MSKEELFEQYVLSDSKEEFLSKLIPDSYHALYFKALHVLNTKPELSEDDLKNLHNLRDRFNTGKNEGYSLHNLDFQHLLRVFDSKSSTAEQRSAALVDLKKYFKINFSPVNSKLNIINNHAAQSSPTATDQKEAVKSVLTPSLVDFDKLIETAYTNLSTIQLIAPQYLNRLDISRLIESAKTEKNSHRILLHFLSSVPNLHAIEQVPLIYQELYESYKRHKEVFNFNQVGYDRLSIKQLNELGALMKTLVFDTTEYQTALIKKQFYAKLLKFHGKSVTQMTVEEKTAKRDLLQSIHGWAKANLPSRLEILIRQLNQEIVVLNEALGNYNKESFIELLASPPVAPTQVFVKKVRDQITRDMIGASNSSLNDLFGFTYLQNPKQLIESYLLVLLKNAENFKPFDEYFEEPFLNKVFYRAKIQSGQQEYISKVGNLFSKAELEQLIESRSIMITDKNSRYVKGNEEVKLLVETKNIQNLVVNIFEIKTEDYYLQNKSQMDQKINLDGLIPLHRTEYTYSEPSNQVVPRSFSLEPITKAERGYFIVDFFGNSISSRAVFQKGLLQLVDTPTIAGHLLCIVDENSNICKPSDGVRTGIWVEGRFHAANADGHIMIPYGKSVQNVWAILVHGSYSELQNLQIKTEDYSYTCVYMYKQESFLQGSKAKVLIRPILNLNSMRANLDVIEEQLIKVSMQNHQGIPTSLEFKDIKFDATKDVEIEIPIQSILRQITIECSGVITKLDGSKQNVHHAKNITFELHQHPENQIYNLYLKNTEALGYAIYALDKSGQPLVKVPIQVSLSSNRYYQEVNEILHTDAEGKVVLGKLVNIKVVKAHSGEYNGLQNVDGQWDIENNLQVELPDSITIVEGELIEVPLPERVPLNKQTVTFYSLNTYGNDFVYEDLFANLKQEGAFLQLEGLTEGTYVLNVLELQKHITIRVIKGNYWKHNSQYILTSNNTFFYAPRQNERMVTVKSAVVGNSAESIQVSLNLPKSLSKTARNKLKVHVFAHNFIQNKQNSVQELQNARANPSLPQVDLRPNPAQFFNNKKIGDEICYVYNRKNEQRRIGNTLEKPCMLLKRTQNRETTFDKERLEDGSNYTHALNEAKSYDMMDESIKRSKRALHHEMNQLYGRHHGCVYPRGEIDSFLNFLKHPSLVLPNNTVDETGVVSIPLAASEWKNYSNIEVILSSDSVAITDNFNVSSEPTQTQDLRHQSAMKSDQLYTENLSSGNLLSGESLLASADSTTAVIGSIPELFEIQKVLMKTGRGTDNYQDKGYSIWAFLKGWVSFTDRQKLDKYNEFASNELNIFLFFKDEKFFTAAVKPFLQNKIQKSFVDYFLLNNVEEILKFSKIEKVNELNVLEQTLLVLALTTNGHKNSAEVIATSLKNIQKTQSKQTELQKRLFLTIIESSAKDEINDVKSSEPMLLQRAEMQMASATSYARPMAMMCMAAPPPGAALEGALRMKMALRSSVAKKETEQLLGDYDDDLCMEAQQCEEKGMLNESSLLQQRKEFKVGYKKLEKTIEYIERQYYNNKETTTYSSLVNVNLFWTDLVSHIISTGGVKNFISQNFIYAFQNHVEALAVLSLLDLSFSVRDNYDLSSQPARKIQVLAKDNVMYFSKEIVQSQSVTKANVGIIQTFFDPLVPFTYMKDDPSVQIEKEVDEFLVNKIYGCKVIVTNISIANLDLSVLTEIPEGSIPVNTFEYTKSVDFTVNSYQTYNNIQFFFYFPQVGEFSIYRSSASRNGIIVAQANAIPNIQVKAVAEIKKLENLSDILNNGSSKDILNFARTANLSDPNEFNMHRIMHIIHADKEFFLSFLDILREKGIFEQSIWEYSLYHNYEQGVLELLNNKTFKSQRMANDYHNLPKLNTDSLSFSNFAVFEYHPLLTSRVHSFMDQNKSKILNVQFKKTFQDFVIYLAHVPKPSASDLLVLSYYLILQERIDEALTVFKRISAPALDETLKIQYDYFSAYLDIYTGAPNFQKARQISEAYIDYPIVSWRNLFVNLSNQLAEYDGEVVDESEQVDSADLSKNLKNAEKEPSLSIEISGKEIIVFHQNATSAELNFFELDLEVLFSTQPFPSGENRNNLSFIKPNHSIRLTFEKTSNPEKTIVEVPENLAKKNLHVQLLSDVGIQNLSYFSSSLKVQTIDKFGQVKVTDESNAPLSKVYVKCFAKYQDNSVEFFRDGYTDLRGRFDYALSSSGDVTKVKSFAIFVSSDDHGAVIREAKPPTEAGKMETTISLLKRK